MPTHCILPAPRQSHSGRTPAGQDLLPLSDSPSTCTTFFRPRCAPAGAVSSRTPQAAAQSAPAPRAARAHTWGHRVLGPASWTWPVGGPAPLTFLPHHEDFSRAQVPTLARVPEDSPKEKAGGPFQPSPYPHPPTPLPPPHSPGTSHSRSSAKPTPPGPQAQGLAPATLQLP